MAESREPMSTVATQSRPGQALQVRIAGRTFRQSDGQPLRVVDALDFSLPARSFTCIVGPSGCGKTTTLRMILGLDRHYEGEIRLPGDGTLAAVFQEPRLLPWRTVEQNVRLVLPEARRDESLDTLFAALGLLDMRHFYPNQLSLGLARRAALARAFVLNPSLLVLDEPFVSLDDDTAERLRALLLQLWQSHPTTALMVTHNREEALSLADHVLVFSDRPARILRRIDIDTPRQARDEAFLRAMLSQLQA